ncbi:protein phosphatase 1H [Contarinia nasturtii]|uniref:protein phosphatase 1H n=1 Tax=Contarinia nasturtii TaxID=265458 RepID=UPI0012D372E7|nr:protein phosphatase 1H [Contarinia nasturtii]XP_031633297.1 protein phosphatase 1H [Contarinia nasturtii]
MEGMFSRIKTKVLSAVNLDNIPHTHTNPSGITIGVAELPSSSFSSNRHVDNRTLPNKFTYNRPTFLQLMTQDELRASADHNVRPIIVPRDISIMPLNTGYAECVNSGKSEWNEDQAAFYRQILTHPTNKDEPGLPYTYFGIFDGHAGFGAALAASHQFHYILHEKLVDVIDLLVTSDNQQSAAQRSKSIDNIPYPMAFYRNVSKDELIIGALESAFLEMDALLAGDRKKYRNAGGCTALVTLFINGKLFVANAGDSRSILCQRLPTTELNGILNGNVGNSTSDLNDSSAIKNGNDNGIDSNANGETDKKMWHVFPTPMSFDHTPETERARLMNTAQLNPYLMAGEYVATEYAKRPMQRDLGKRVLYRHGSMVGWAYKTLTFDDLKIPIVTGEGKRSRLLGTIGVTRGFGDHDLRALCTGLSIKPFLSPHPEVVSRDLTKVVSCPKDNNEDGEYGVLVMATDGLWDVLDIDTVSKTVFNTLNKYPVEKHRYTMVAQELVAKSRGRANEAGHWRLTESKAAATVDDISVLVIPVYQYYKEYIEWKTGYLHRKQNLNTDDELPEEHKGEIQIDKNADLATSFNSISVKSDSIFEAEEAKAETETNANEPKPDDKHTEFHVNGKLEPDQDNQM